MNASDNSKKSGDSESAADGIRHEDARATRIEQLTEEIEQTLGFFPHSLTFSLRTSVILESIWQQTSALHVKNPLPRLLKEKLFALLSRFCPNPTALIARSSALLDMGLSGIDLLGLLRSPVPSEVHIVKALSVLDHDEKQGWGRGETEQERSAENAFLVCCTFLYLYPMNSSHYHMRLKHAIGEGAYLSVISFLGFVRMFHAWIGSEPIKDPEEDAGLNERLNSLAQRSGTVAAFCRTHIRQAAATESLSLQTGDNEPAASDSDDENDAGEHEYLLSLLNLSTDRLCVIGMDGFFRYANTAFTTAMGCTREELLFTPLIELVHPEDRGLVLEKTQTLTANDKKAEFECRCRWRDGTYRPLAWSTWGSDSEIYYAVVSSVTSITPVSDVRGTLR